jgi:hypothetical protein
MVIASESGMINGDGYGDGYGSGTGDGWEEVKS